MTHIWVLCLVAQSRPTLPWGFSRQEYWSGLPCPPAGDLPDSRMELTSLMSPALAGGFFTTDAAWEAQDGFLCYLEYKVKSSPQPPTSPHADCFLPPLFFPLPSSSQITVPQTGWAPHRASCAPSLVWLQLLCLLWVGMGIKGRKLAWTWRRRVTPWLARRRITQQRVHLASSLQGPKGMALLGTLSQCLPTAPADDSQLLCSRWGPKVRVSLHRRMLPLPAPSSNIPLLPGFHSDHKPGAASF